MMADLFAYERPRTLERALELVGERRAIVCGGTDFYPGRLYQRRHESVVDVSSIEELRGITSDGTVWRVGATTTWSDVRDAELPVAFDGLRAAARQVGAIQIQNAGTVAGNICTASPAGDGIPPLLTLNAQVELRSSSSTRVVDLARFITGYRSTDRREDELVTAIFIPEPGADSRGAFVKFGQRSSLVISLVMVATLVEFHGDRIGSARVAVGACSPVATRLAGVEEALMGVRAEPSTLLEALREANMSELTPIDDVRASGNYRTMVTPQLIVDSLLACGERS
jgi:CO/xanthine dehydrogenase FAD-binding subunit